MELREGIRILGHEPKFWMSEGVENASVLKLSGYNSEAYVPREWRAPLENEKEILQQTESTGDSNRHIAIVKVPVSLMQKFEDLGLRDFSRLEDFIPFVQDNAYRSLEVDLVNWARTFLASEEKFLKMSPVLNPPGLQTVTIQGPTGQLLGLHLDSWDAGPLNARETASNRISINLGREPRYLLFINLPMIEIIESLPEEERRDELVVLSFLRRYPNYPVVKVRVAPGEAYIAPTENMIHDGSTTDRTSADIHLTIRGHFLTDLNLGAR